MTATQRPKPESKLQAPDVGKRLARSLLVHGDQVERTNLTERSFWHAVSNARKVPRDFDRERPGLVGYRRQTESPP